MEALRRSQANVVCQYLNAKRYHWFTYGPLFRDLHLLFDEIAMVNQAQIDPLGERLRILGGDPVSAPEELSANATIPISRSKGSPAEMLSEALQSERKMVEEMRRGARLADEEGDYGTNDLFATAVQEHEKYVWFLSEALRRGDGIVS
jgi:starvation-inducible DNA-binding protein